MKQMIATHLIKMNNVTLTNTLHYYYYFYDSQRHWSILAENHQSACDDIKMRWLHHASLEISQSLDKSATFFNEY